MDSPQLHVTYVWHIRLIFSWLKEQNQTINKLEKRIHNVIICPQNSITIPFAMIIGVLMRCMDIKYYICDDDNNNK